MFKQSPFRLAILSLSAAAICAPARADTLSINLGNYSVAGTYGLDRLGTTGNPSGLEASAVTYARDRGTLFYVGDEGTGVVEISLTGQTISTMTFSGGSNLGWPAASSNRDSEGLTYLGNGVLVVAEERLYDAFRFSYVAGGTVNLANADYVSISNANVGNNGLEGISYDPRGAGSFVTVKQQSSLDILAGTLTFATGAGGMSTMSQLFNPALMGVSTLSDVQTLSPVDALAGTTAADNLLVLSLGSRKLIEVNRSGTVLSSFDLSSVLNSIGGDFNAIEGVTVDENGTIYLVAEQLQGAGETLTSQSQLVVLTVPEPGSAAFLGAGLGILGSFRRRRKAL